MWPGFKIYPNPTSGEISIQSPGFNYHKMEITNLLGEKVMEQIFEQNPEETAHFRLILKLGIYILTLSRNNQKVSAKLIIQ